MEITSYICSQRRPRSRSYLQARIAHQLNDTVTPIILSEWFNMKYIHLPFEDNGWEKLMNLGQNTEKIPSGLQRIIINKPFNVELLRRGVSLDWILQTFSNIKPNVIYELERHKKTSIRIYLHQLCKWADEDKISFSLYNRIIQRLRNCYFSSNHPVKSLKFSNKHVNIAIHLRREDVVPERQMYWLPLSFYEKAAINIHAIMRELNLKHVIRIYSYGSKEQMNDISSSNIFRKLKVQLHLNECMYEAFHSMVISDIIVVPRSGFSYWAGFLSSGIKLYNEWWHAPLNFDKSAWLTINDSGNFDKQQIKKLLHDGISMIKF